MSPLKPEEFESGGVEAHRLLVVSTRLKEVRRRYVAESGDEERFAQAGDYLDSIISDLDGWLRPGGKPVEIGDLDLRLAAIEEMIEVVGFPGYARVIASVREGLSDPSEDYEAEEEPPPPQRYQPSATFDTSRSASEDDLDEWETRAAAERRQEGRGWLIRLVLIGGCLVAAVLLFLWQGETGRDVPHRNGRGVVEEPEALQPTAAPIPTSNPNAANLEGALDSRNHAVAQFEHEVNRAREALSSADLDAALQHFAAAASIDHRDGRVSDLAGPLIDALLKEADSAFDNGEWNLAADRVEVARRIARGLYFDLSVIDHTAQKHAAMTRFEDITASDPRAFGRAVGHAVRVTRKDGDVIYGRVEAFEDDSLLLEVYSGVEGGGVQFSKMIPLAIIRELRIFEAERPSETVLGQ